MKTRSFFFMLSILIMISCNNMKTDSKNELFKGVSVKYTVWRASEDTLLQVNNLPHLNYLEDYNLAGELIRVTNFLNDSIINSYTINYFEKGILMLSERYDRSEDLILKKHFYYDKKGNLIKELSENLSVQNKVQLQYIYDNDGNLLKKELTDENKAVNEYWKYSYEESSDGKTIREEFYRKDQLEAVTVVQYNSNNLEVEKSIENPLKSKVTHFMYEYLFSDQYPGHWIRKKIYKDGKLQMEYRKDIIKADSPQ